MCLKASGIKFGLLSHNSFTGSCDCGLQLASSPREVAEAVDVTLVMMADPVAALAVALGPTGAVAGLSEGGRPGL